MADSEYDVVVVGAGMAGLVAALDLVAAGRTVTVLERQERPGGRVTSDHRSGFTLDRGFQVLNTSYPQVRRRLDLPALDPRPFNAGALVRYAEKLHRLGDPRCHPGALPDMIGSSLLPWQAKLALAAYSADVGFAPLRRLLQAKETTAAESLARRRLAGPAVERFLRPFLSGVLAEDQLTTSSRFVDLVWRSFVRGTVIVPAAGMGAIPAQLAARLPAGTLRTGVEVEQVTPGLVRSDGQEVRPRAVVVATDPATAGKLLPRLRIPPMRGLTTYYHAASEPPLAEPTLLLDGADDRMIVNSVVLTATAPSYSTDGRALISTSVLGPTGRDGGAPPDEAEIRPKLSALYGVPTDGWDHVETTVVREALPAAPPPLGDLRKPVDLGEGLFVAGDHRDTPSTQGAMASGTRAARAVLRHLGDG
ncbi:NAD(P)/FAD-dependent oxidoreductase [Actinopolymorpha sp. NPDC004070]|uniref:protoporphyrinogen/coproporphyrinogen oxidase n=1 Tax=Actinopolymorpha sp. NPDC004070 TaxID=3154548 RepID=UPI0033A0865B